MARVGATKHKYYWCITDKGRVECHCQPGDAMDRRMAIGNYFETREEACQVVQRLRQRVIEKAKNGRA